MRKIAAIICNDCRKGYAFFSHDPDTGSCSTIVREIKIQGIRFSQLCACPENEKSLMVKTGKMRPMHQGKNSLK